MSVHVHCIALVLVQNFHRDSLNLCHVRLPNIMVISKVKIAVSALCLEWILTIFIFLYVLLYQNLRHTVSLSINYNNSEKVHDMISEIFSVSVMLLTTTMPV